MNRNQRSYWSVCVSRIQVWHLPKLKLLILSNETTSCILLPVSNGEIDVNDQKEKFLLLFWKKKMEEKWVKPHQGDGCWFHINYCFSSFKCQYHFSFFSFFYAHWQIIRVGHVQISNLTWGWDGMKFRKNKSLITEYSTHIQGGAWNQNKSTFLFPDLYKLNYVDLMF